MASQIKLRRDTAANWTATNPVLGAGEPGYDTTNKKLKIGDGTTAWNSLAYFDDKEPNTFDGSYNSLTGKPTIPNLGSIAENIVPDADNTRDLGTPDKQWRHVYTAGGSIYLDNIKLSNVNGKFVATKVINPGEDDEAEDPEDSDATSEISGGADLGLIKIDAGIIGTVDSPNTGNWGGYGLTLDPGGESNAYISIPSVEQQEDGGSLIISNKGTAESVLALFGRGSVQIVTNTGEGEEVFEFRDDGKLQLPPGGDIVDSTGTSVLGGGSGLPTVTIPAAQGSTYKGLQVSYGVIHSNGNPNELNVNKIVIHKPAQTTAEIDPTGNTDYFRVSGLGDSDVLAMFVIFGDVNGAKPLSDLQTFAQAAIDNVILTNGVEGNYNTVENMRVAFYENYATLASAANGLDLDFEFYNTFTPTTLNTTTVIEGSGAVVNFGEDGAGGYTFIGMLNGSINYKVGHKLVVLGSVTGGADGVNDAIFTVTSVDISGAITGATVTGASFSTAPVGGWFAPAANYNVGFGFSVAGINFNANGTFSSFSLNSQGAYYVMGDQVVLLGSNIQNGVSPTNDITITITSVDGNGGALTWVESGTYPRVWPENNISDGGNDQYDTANYINTENGNGLSYNQGNIVPDAQSIFGVGSSYTFVYDTGIFGLLVTGNSSTFIETSGGSGADGNSITEAGNIYGPDTAAQTFNNAVTHINVISNPYAGPIVTFVRPNNSDETIDILIPDTVSEYETIWNENEAVWVDVRDQDAQIIAPATRPWAGMSSYNAYPLIINYTTPNGVLPPANNMVVVANSAKNAYNTWQAALAELGPARGVAIARSSNGNGIYNPYREEGWDNTISPDGIGWNIDGWNDLSDVTTRTYVNLYAAFGFGGLGNKIVGTECVIYLPDNGKYYAVKFDSWTQNNQGGGFAYTRRELDLDNLQEGIRFPDGTRLKSAEGIGRVKLQSPGNRRIEEVYGYKSVALSQVVTTNLTAVASRSSNNTFDIWIDSTATTIDDIISNPQNYNNAYGFEFSIDNNIWYAWGGSTGFDGNERAYSIPPTLVTYNQGDTIYFRYKTGGAPVVWWNAADLPGGSSNFRGAVIDYHAFTGESTIIGTIHIVDDDGEENITHTEVTSGSTDGENDDLWLVQNEGTISYRRIDGEGKTLRVQWSAKVFYGSEIWD